MGVAVATNTLKGDGNAALKGFGSVMVGGDLSLSSTSTRTIDSTSVAVAIGAAIGSKFSLGLAGGGANALNTITGGSQALLWADTIQADKGSISLSGTSSDTITAQVQAIAGAGQGSATGSGGAVSIGASVARNRLGVSSDGPDASGDGLAIGASVRGRDGQAGVKSLAAQSLTLKAEQTSTIDATVGATSAAIAWTNSGSVGVAASGAGSEATNTLKQNVTAEVVGAGDGATLTLGGGDLTLSVNDTSSLTTTAWGAALAVSVAPAAQITVAPAVGLSLVDNTLIRRQKAALQGFRRDGNGFGVGSAGAVAVTSGSTGRIQATSVAVAISGAVAKGLAVGLAGGGARSFNTILGTNQALIEGSDLGVESAPIDGTLTVTATDSTTIDSEVDAIAAGGGTAAAAIGVALSRNFIGETQGNSGVSGGDPKPYDNSVVVPGGWSGKGNLLQASISGSNLYLSGDLTLKAEQRSTITAYVDSFAAALGAAKEVGIALSGSGAESTNRTLQTVLANLGQNQPDPSARTALQAGAVTVQAKDTSSIDATAWGPPWGLTTAVPHLSAARSVSPWRATP